MQIQYINSTRCDYVRLLKKKNKAS